VNSNYFLATTLDKIRTLTSLLIEMYMLTLKGSLGLKCAVPLMTETAVIDTSRCELDVRVSMFWLPAP